ncbi:unnamed protein product [Polarella glacialis]|uniref:Uncharacterized protein n=1 Tax=Polarella glacialis TaxID=89957 RepID=A0A813ED59_POLGL|nr:unnamed protein product [Polarella glacialis]
MAMADSVRVEGPVKAPKKFSIIAGNWKMRDGQHPEELLFVHRHFSANSSVKGPAMSFLELLSEAPFYLFISDNLQFAKSRFGRSVITTRIWRLDGTEQFVGPPMGFCPELFCCSQVDSQCSTMEHYNEQVLFAGAPLGFCLAHLRCSHVDSQCLRLELKQDTEIIELKFQLGKKSTAAQLQVTFVGSERIVFDAQFVRVKAFPSNVGSQAHSSQAVPSLAKIGSTATKATTPSASACPALAFEPILESSAEAESTEDESMEN